MDPSPSQTVEKPRNGLAGLKYWKSDLVAGLLVSLISLPFSLGIAVASGAPPIAGLISAIIAGLLLPFLGGSYVTISGPAAGLAPVLLASMLTLGRGSTAVGYPLLLAVICMVGVVQILLALSRAARFSAIFPAAVVEGMLASIGLLIIAKQMPHLIGHPFHSHEFWGYVRETPEELWLMEPRVFGLGMFCLVFIFWLASLKARWTKLVPTPVVMVAVGTVISLFLGLDKRFLIQIPANPFSHGIVTPNFAALWADGALWWSVATIVLTLTLIDGVESLATASAIDKIDPYHRKSDPNRTLLAMGVLNICSSVAGGLTIIPGGVKSKACIEGGGKTLWANFYNSILLLSYLLLARRLINLVPYAALAAMLIHTGWKLCRPAIWRHVAHIGREQLALFAMTVVVTISTDLLIGIIFGIVAKLLMSAVYAAPDYLLAPGRGRSYRRLALSSIGHAPDLFRNPVTGRSAAEGTYHLDFGRPLVCFNSMHLNDELHKVPADAGGVCLHMNEGVTLIDHTSCDALIHFADEFRRNGRGEVDIIGLDRMVARSHYPSSMRLGPPVPAGEPPSTSTSPPTHAALAAISLSRLDPTAGAPGASLWRLGLVADLPPSTPRPQSPRGLVLVPPIADPSTLLARRLDAMDRASLIHRLGRRADPAEAMACLSLGRDEDRDHRGRPEAGRGPRSADSWL